MNIPLDLHYAIITASIDIISIIIITITITLLMQLLPRPKVTSVLTRYKDPRPDLHVATRDFVVRNRDPGILSTEIVSTETAIIEVAASRNYKRSPPPSTCTKQTYIYK